MLLGRVMMRSMSFFTELVCGTSSRDRLGQFGPWALHKRLPVLPGLRQAVKEVDFPSRQIKMKEKHSNPISTGGFQSDLPSCTGIPFPLKTLGFWPYPTALSAS